MKEEFLYYLWENRLLKSPLQTTSGEQVEVLTTGHRNTNAGPDFLEAKVKIGETLWAGQVEIHVKTSDWERHHHQTDKAYQNVILHLVYENDALRPNLPTVVLKGRFDEAIFEHYESFLKSRTWIPCANSIATIQKFTWLNWLDRVGVERLESKSLSVKNSLEHNHFDWEETLYRLISHYFGLKVNNEAFEYLATILPMKVLAKHADNLTQVEAMLFGCAGLLENNFSDEYPRLLKREFTIMKSKFDLLTMPAERWKFMRMRPVNFPTIRIAQLAQLICMNRNIFSLAKEANEITELKEIFNVSTSPYWESHFQFDKESRPFVKHFGETASDVLIINAVVPILFYYGKYHAVESYCDKAIGWMENLEAEDNQVIRHFAELGFKAQNALQSQALIHLYSNYCKKRRCLDCRIGHVIMKTF